MKILLLKRTCSFYNFVIFLVIIKVTFSPKIYKFDYNLI